MDERITISLLSHGDMKKEEMVANVVAAAAATSEIMINNVSTDSTDIFSTRPCDEWENL